MRCENALEKISALIDGELNEDEREEVQAHINDCASCRAVYAAYLGIDDALRQDAQEPPAALRENVMRAVRADKKKTASRPLKGILAAVLAAAAVFIVLCGAGVIDLPGFSEDGQANVSVGQTLRERIERSQQEKQAQKMAEENGCAVLALWAQDAPPALKECTFSRQNGARVYAVEQQTAQEIAQEYLDEDAIWFVPEALQENESVLIVWFS